MALCRRIYEFLFLALASLSCCFCQVVLPQSLAEAYTLTSSTTLSLPTATLSSSDTNAFLVSTWGLSKGRIQNSPEDLSFVSDPYPNSTIPGTSNPVSNAPVLQVAYPANSFSPQEGGTQLYSLFNGSEPFQSMLLSYEIAFDQGFDWVKGGKLPGIRGGPDPNGCSGGVKPNGTNCFSMRLMWRPEGAGEIYAYIPTTNNICDDKDFICNPDFGISIQRGSFSFQSGLWNQITMLVLLNSPVDTANGYVELYFNNVLAISQKNLQIRASDAIAAGGLYFSTFFGGNDSSWETPSTQQSYYRNIQLWAGSSPSNQTGPKASFSCSKQQYPTIIVLVAGVVLCMQLIWTSF